ncbi:hypothetical protein [Caballeronia cordobensis]|uniref:hypothetical protein n=1 Tax=Caballeronia cordobensis TaxID=1353886 RepID=UPI00045EEB73|nr:hypothetical protein BRPE67_CCDS07510 [Burkholderia sp. RPE67]
MGPRRRPRLPNGNTSRYDAVRVETLWVELYRAASSNALPPSDAYPGFPRLPKEIKRIRRALYDDELGLGLQLRWNLALDMLKGRVIESGPFACADAKQALELKLGFGNEFHQLGSMPGQGEPRKSAGKLHEKSASAYWLSELCGRLNAMFGPEYRKVNVRHRMTSDLFQTPYFSEDAVEEFNNLLRTGEPSLTSRVNRTLIKETKQYYPSIKRNEIQDMLVSRLAQTNACRPVQCVVCRGAPTAVEAFALHLSQMLPTALKNTRERVGGLYAISF